MKIVLVETSGQQGPGEQTFEQPVVRLGRDPAQCQIVFDQATWPMVSRRHCEFRLSEGRCLLVDLNSSFGTFLNGQRVTEPLEVQAGALVQCGLNGPIMRVVRIEDDAVKPVGGAGQTRNFGLVTQVDSSLAYKTRIDPALAFGPEPGAPETTPPAVSQPPVQAARPLEPAAIELVDEASGQSLRVPLTGDAMLLGRDPASGVPIDAAAAVVSRRHAEIRRHDNQFILFDLNSFNGTLLNDQRITAPTRLYDGDRIQLGTGGPLQRFIDASQPPPTGAHQAGQHVAGGFATQVMTAAELEPESGPLTGDAIFQRTIAIKSGGASLPPPPRAGAMPAQLLMQRPFDGKRHLTVGRAPDNDIRLDGLQISNHHARIFKTGDGCVIEDAGSTNGVYVNGTRISGRKPVAGQDVVQIGPFMLRVDAAAGVAVLDTRSKTRIDAVDVTKIVPNRSGGGQIRLLDDVDLTIQPNEFVGLLGPSGAGKSTLMDALNGMRPASNGKVLVNNLDLYQHLDVLKQSIGYVPQDDIIHRELTVYRTLYYVARLRLSRDVSRKEIDQIISEVLDVTGLTERRDVPVAQLSGGQRKRVSIAVELITKPSIIFLDEPTSGLDPATEEKIMRLFRQIAESGRTVILTTHAMENVRLFDKIVVLMRGRLVFYGTPKEALDFVHADSFKDLYVKLEAPIEQQLRQLPPLPPNATRDQKRAFDARRQEITEAVAEDWKRRFQQTEAYRRYILEPSKGLKTGAPSAPPARHHATVTDAVRQWATLARRSIEVLRRDPFNLLILFGQAPLIGILTYLVVGTKSPRDFPYFTLSLVALWFGTSVAAREIVKERPVFKRERMVNLGLLPFLGSKLLVLSLIVGVQCALLFGTLQLFHHTGLMYLPGILYGIPQFAVMLLTGLVGIALGLLISALVKTSEMATSLVPLVLIPQILFSGLMGVPQNASRIVGLLMPTTWSFDEMKRLSQLDTLSKEGSDPNGPNRGRGLYKHIEQENEENIERVKKDVAAYRQQAEENAKEFERRINEYLARAPTDPSLKRPEPPVLGPAPDVPAAAKVTDDLSTYVDFKHPWGHVLLNPLVLIVMFFGLVIATLITLRAQDVR